jgi:hypothetical protein
VSNVYRNTNAFKNIRPQLESKTRIFTLTSAVHRAETTDVMPYASQRYSADTVISNRAVTRDQTFVDLSETSNEQSIRENRRFEFLIQIFKAVLFAHALMLFIIGLCSPMMGQGTVSVVGVVVGRDGNPQANVTVQLLSDACKECTDNIIPSYVTSNDGLFFLDSTVLRNREVRLLVEGSVPDNLWNPLLPINHRLKAFPEFKGKLLDNLTNGKTVQIGNIYPHIIYRRVSLDISPLLQQKFAGQGDTSTKLSVEYKGKLVLDKLLVHDRSLDLAKGYLTIALPQGEWIVQVELEGAMGKRTKRFHISK